MENKNKANTSEKLITRKEAIKKVGLTALTTSSLLLLQTKAHAQDSATRGATPGKSRPTRPGE